MPQQLSFDLPSVPALDRADFMVAPSNAMALAMIENWRSWTGRKMVLSGPEGAGKSHLAHVWASLSGAKICLATDVTEDNVPTLAQRSVAIEDVPQIAQNPQAQTALFHLHNLVLAEGHSLLITGKGAPAHWGLTLPDLASRIAGTQMATLDPPDDALLAAVLAKLFADRQLAPKPEVISYIVLRVDRSFAAARTLVAALDAASLAQKRPITKALAASVLDKL